LKKGQTFCTLQAAAAAEQLGGFRLGSATRVGWGGAAELQCGSGRGRRSTEQGAGHRAGAAASKGRRPHSGTVARRHAAGTEAGRGTHDWRRRGQRQTAAGWTLAAVHRSCLSSSAAGCPWRIPHDDRSCSLSVDSSPQKTYTLFFSQFSGCAVPRPTHPTL
jgi:hypothetical protein